jgi:hypothetical protein
MGLLHVRIGAAVEQQLHRGRIARVRGEHEHRFAFGGEHGVRVLARVEQAADGGGTAVHRGEIDRPHTLAVHRVHVGARREQRVHHRDIVALHGPVQRRHAVELGGIHVVGFHERPHGGEIAAHRGVHQRGPGLRHRPSADEREHDAGFQRAGPHNVPPNRRPMGAAPRIT